jgi:hypothetical protein
MGPRGFTLRCTAIVSREDDVDHRRQFAQTKKNGYRSSRFSFNRLRD